MKISYKTTAVLNADAIFLIMKESIEQKTDKQLAHIVWLKTDSGIECELVFRDETVDLSNAPKNS